MSQSGGARALFGDDVVVEEVFPISEEYPLRPEESAVVARALPKRRKEFAAGRHCARLALRRFGIHDYALVPGPDRVPRWPAGVVRSISHTDDYCIAAVARRSSVAAIGVDAEPREPLEPELWDSICTGDERRWLARQPEAERGHLVRLIFSAKECTYKCQYPLTGCFLEFHDLQVELDRERGQFTARFLKQAGAAFPVGAMAEGKLVIRRHLIFTGMVRRHS